MVLILIFSEVLGLYGCVFALRPAAQRGVNLACQTHCCIDYEYEGDGYRVCMIFSSTFPYTVVQYNIRFYLVIAPLHGAHRYHEQFWKVSCMYYTGI
jgi:hypothetical protein